ncbi:MAG: beta-ketoacyl-ACP synthase III [Alphaproteobacteria bacterium]
MVRSVLCGTGSYLPKRIVTNEELASIVETTDAWIQERTGIKQRHRVADGEFTSDLACAAAFDAIKDANIDPTSIDLVIVATATPDFTFPAVAAKVQAALGCHGVPAFDIQAVCSGFIYALSVADSMIRSGSARRAMVIGAETFSRILDFEDRTTCVLFGDGAGAVILDASTDEDCGILATALHADGRHHDLLYVDGGPSRTKTVGHLRMVGQEVYKHAVTELSNVLQEVMEKAGLVASDIDWIVPHQANKRILLSTARKLQIDFDKVIVTIGEHGNTSAASVPLALDKARKDGRILPNQTLLLEAMGGGLTWGAAILRT